jgi:hypothetical protein
LKLNFADKLMPILTKLVTEASKLSWVALICMLVIAGVLMLIGNEHGSNKLMKLAIKGYALIQIAAMLL